MKKIELLEIEDEKFGEFSYKKHILSMLESPKSKTGGTNYQEMVKIIPTIQKVNDADGFLLLEDAEWEDLKERAETFGFTINHPVIYDMVDAIVNAETVKIAEVK